MTESVLRKSRLCNIKIKKKKTKSSCDEHDPMWRKHVVTCLRKHSIYHLKFTYFFGYKYMLWTVYLRLTNSLMNVVESCNMNIVKIDKSYTEKYKPDSIPLCRGLESTSRPVIYDVVRLVTSIEHHWCLSYVSCNYRGSTRAVCRIICMHHHNLLKRCIVAGTNLLCFQRSPSFCW